MQKCKDIMTRSPAACTPYHSAKDAAVLMKKHNVGSIPIVDNTRNLRLLGIVTDRDLALRVAADGADPEGSVSEIMTPAPLTCGPEDDLQKAIGLMEKRQVRRIPVVNKWDKLIGIISQADIATRGGEAEKTAEVVEEVSRPAAFRAR